MYIEELIKRSACLMNGRELCEKHINKMQKHAEDFYVETTMALVRRYMFIIPDKP